MVNLLKLATEITVGPFSRKLIMMDPFMCNESFLTNPLY